MTKEQMCRLLAVGDPNNQVLLYLIENSKNTRQHRNAAILSSEKIRIKKETDEVQDQLKALNQSVLRLIDSHFQTT